MSAVNSTQDRLKIQAQKGWNGSVQGQESYHELAEASVQEIDLTEQLRSNISRLSDLHGRLSFMMREVNGLTTSRLNSKSR